jgi:hypothetical protein
MLILMQRAQLAKTLSFLSRTMISTINDVCMACLMYN